MSFEVSPDIEKLKNLAELSEPSSAQNLDLVQDFKADMARNLPQYLEAAKDAVSGQENAAELLAYLDQVTFEITEPSQTEDGWERVTVIVRSESSAPAELQKFVLVMAEAGLSEEETWELSSESSNQPELEKTETGWLFKLERDPDDIAELGMSMEQVEALVGTTSDIINDYLTITYTVTLPGSLETTNGEIVAAYGSSTTASWQLLSSDDGESSLLQSIVLETSTSSKGLPLWLILTLAGIVVLLTLTLLPRRYQPRLQMMLGGDKAASPATAAAPAEETASANPVFGTTTPSTTPTEAAGPGPRAARPAPEPADEETAVNPEPPTDRWSG